MRCCPARVNALLYKQVKQPNAIHHVSMLRELMRHRHGLPAVQACQGTQDIRRGIVVVYFTPPVFLSYSMWRRYTPFLLSKPVKALVLAAFFAYLGVSLAGAPDFFMGGCRLVQVEEI